MQKPANISGLVNAKSGHPAWEQLPTWYEVSEYDHAIPPGPDWYVHLITTASVGRIGVALFHAFGTSV